MRGHFGWHWWLRGLRPRTAAGVGAALLGMQVALAVPATAEAQPLSGGPSAKVKIGFSNLVARLDNDEIGLAKAEYRVHILEALRAAGFNAVGAESLVFERDEGRQADLVLGGTIREVACRRVRRKNNCRIGIEWELLDREQDAVVYRVLSRHMEADVDVENGPVTGRRLVLGALKRLLARGRFTALLNRANDTPQDEPFYPLAGFQSCPLQQRELPRDFEQAADATFLIKQARGFGSGFNISPDGLVLTAAHVVGGRSVELQQRGGTSALSGTVVRMSRKHDVALIAVPSLRGSGHACLELASEAPAPGDDIYAIGTPASTDLAFSLTRGIVSGLRLLEGIQLIQTDASLNPGNSGGPLLDGKARVVAVVTKKLAGQAIEGLGFGIQIQDALRGLALQTDTLTAAMLLETQPPARPAPAAGNVGDNPDPVPSLDPVGDRQRRAAAEYAQRLHEQELATPWYVKPMRWGGLTLAIAGSLGVVYSTTQGNQSEIKRADFEKYRTQNDVSWAACLLGTGAFVASFPLQPPLRPASKVVAEARGSGWSVVLGPGDVNVGLRYEP